MGRTPRSAKAQPQLPPPPGPQVQADNTFGERVNDMGAKLTETLLSETRRIDEKVTLTMATHDAKIDGIEKALMAKLDSKPGHGAQIGYVVAGVAAIIAVLAFGGDRFSGGMSASGAFSDQLIQRSQQEVARDRMILDARRQLENQLGQIREEQRRQREPTTNVSR